MIRCITAAVIALPMLASCSTFEPEPCTAKWFDWKTERIVGQFAYDHRQQIDDFRRSAPALLNATGGLEQFKPTSLMVLTALGAMQLTVDFMQDAWPEVNHAIGQCATAPKASRFFADMLRRENVDERAVRAIEDLGNLVDSVGR